MQQSHSTSMKFTNKIIAVLLAFCFVLINMGSYTAYAATSFTEADFVLPQCENINSNNLRIELTDIIQESFNREIQIDIESQVNSQWIYLDIDNTIDSEIDKAVDKVSNNTGLGEKIRSNWSKRKIKELTGEIVKLAFESPSSEVTNKISLLSKNVADRISANIESSAIASASQAMNCIQKFVGEKYSKTMLNAFNDKLVSLSQSTDPSKSFKNNSPSRIEVNKDQFVRASIAIAIIGRRVIINQVKNFSTRLGLNIGERILGRLAFLEVPFIGEVVAALLTVQDVVQGFNGALPVIQENLKKPELKNNVRQQITVAFESELKNETSQLAGVISNETYSLWLGFKDDFRQLLDIAQDSPNFRRILDANQERLGKLTSLVGILLNITGRSQLLAYIEDGTFERLFTLPESAYEILTNSDRKSGDKVLKFIQWVDLAGDKLNQVISTQLYKHLSPVDLDRQLLSGILTIQDSRTINKLSLLEVNSIRKLLVLSKKDLIAITNRLSPDNLQIIAGYFDGLKQIEINRIVKFLLSEKMPDNNVLAHIVESRNINAAIDFWKKPSLFWSIPSMLTFNISWKLFTDVFGLLIILPFALFVLPILTLLLIALRYYRPNESQELHKPTES